MIYIELDQLDNAQEDIQLSLKINEKLPNIHFINSLYNIKMKSYDVF